MAKTIEKILTDAARKNIVFDKSLESLEWFKNKARRMTSVTASSLIREYEKPQLRQTSQLAIGKMYMFFYDPKYKEELPYYDRFPCVFLTDAFTGADGKSHYAGLNIHYLPYKQRAILMDGLLDLENNARLDRNKKLNIGYGILKGAEQHWLFRPCYKRYLRNHVRSRLVEVPYEEWKVAAFLPVHEFEKKSAQEVWRESMRKAKAKR